MRLVPATAQIFRIILPLALAFYQGEINDS